MIGAMTLQAEATVADERVATLARALVDGGRFVPGVEVDDDGRARSWWWPMPAASDRAALSGVVAAELANLVDAEVRSRLAGTGTTLTPRRGGRRSVPDSWLHSLGSSDPWMPESLNTDKARELKTAVAAWVRSGVPATGRVRLCLRIVAPETGSTPARASDTWAVELLVQDTEESSLIVPISKLWDGTAALGGQAIEDVLRALGHLERLAPELGGLLDQAEPVWAAIEAPVAVELLRDRLAALTDAGIAVLLPTWWTRRKPLTLRMKTTSRSNSQGAATKGGLGMNELVKFRWEAALGDAKLTRRDLDRLRAAAEAKQTIVRFRGEWVEVDPATLMELDGLIGKTAETTVGEILRSSLGLSGDQAPRGVEVTEVVGTGWLGDLLDDAVHATVAPAETPTKFHGELRPYQERGVGWLGFLGRLGLGGCLADDMGLGKTAQVIASLLDDPVDAPTLVICPVSVLGNWSNELARFAPSLKVLVHHGPARLQHDEPFSERVAAHDIVLTTYSLIDRDSAELTAVDWGRAVLDEAQNVKNPTAKQTKAVAQLNAERRIALTGTPVENSLSELWSIMHIINPGLLGTAKEFRERFAVPIERDHDPDATETLGRLTRPFLLRRLKSDKSIISDLPDKIETVDHCLLTHEQASLYQAVVDDMLAKADESDGIQRRGLVLAGLMRLKQVCNHPAHYLGDGSALTGRSGKLNRVEELIDELLAAGDKALCFTQFREWGTALQPYLAQRFGVEVLWLHGGVRRPKRDAMVERFNEASGPPLFLISVKAGGTGLNLTSASHVIHLDRWWNPAVEDQATDRAYRIGQQRNVFVHKPISVGTVEEKIDELIASKRDLADRTLGKGEQWLTELSTDDLRELVSLR